MSSHKDNPQVVDVDIARVEDVLERARAALSAEDHECLVSLVETLVELTKLVRERGTTIARLRHLFGLKSSAKTADVLKNAASSATPPASAPQPDPPADAPSASAPPTPDHRADPDADAATADAGAEQPDARKGHGRIGASEYPDARRITVAHQSLHVGDACPACPRGKLYRLREPSRIVRISGQAPLAATAWECERLRCSSCSEVFTARAPDEAQGPKYDASAASVLALLRYFASRHFFVAGTAPLLAPQGRRDYLIGRAPAQSPSVPGTALRSSPRPSNSRRDLQPDHVIRCAP